MIEPSRIRIGSKVQKATGFKFPGIVQSIFYTRAGAERCVVEADHPDFAGMLHIYNPNQLVLVDDPQWIKDSSS